LNVHNVSAVRQIGIHTSETRVPGSLFLRLKLLLQSSKGIQIQVVITFRDSWSKEKAKHYCLQSTKALILFGIRKNCLIGWRNPLLYQFTKRAIRLTVIIIVRYHCNQLHTKCYHSQKVKSIYRRNYWGASVWVST
jgi:hypothetical protein